MMDYSKAHTNTSKAIPMIHMVLKFAVNAIMSGCGLERWRIKMALHGEHSIQWNGDIDFKAIRQSVTQVLSKLTPFFQVEVTSILEMALWKMKSSNSILVDERSRQDDEEEVDRESCRIICKADDVMSNVVGLLWDESPSAAAVNSLECLAEFISRHFHGTNLKLGSSQSSKHTSFYALATWRLFDVADR